ncbi:somatostatin-1-like [Clinocottus analis]|uniref:somatostatin-1-like n=1 Tax=Clinocottus analis TaxID=304258 RepID=UPI0035C02D72
MAHLLCICALLCLALCVDAETESGFKDLQLQQDLLPWLNKLQDQQESTKRQTWIEWLHKLSMLENRNSLEGAADEEKQEKNRRGLVMKTRRLGCRVFFWKSWAVC